MNIKVKGGQKLEGEVMPSGSKNSAVALISSSILFDKPVVLRNVPDIKDVEMLFNILEKLGSRLNWNRQEKKVEIDNSNISFSLVNKGDWAAMRGTSLLWGPMLARFKKIDFSGLPGGCTLGFRTLDPHFKALEALGANIKETTDSVKMSLNHAHSATFWLTEMSPTATENAVMLASSIGGETKIIGAATEPQVQDLCNFLSQAGVEILGIGSSVLTINGIEKPKPVDYEMLSDHYEIATFLAMSAITSGRIKVKNPHRELFVKINEVFSKFNIEVCYENGYAYVKDNGDIRIKPDSTRDLLTIKAQPWPGLPVDLLPLFIPIALSAPSGQVLFHNWMYNAGLFWTSELTKLGGNILMCDPHRILTIGGTKLTSGVMEAPYIIRAVVAMVMAAMITEGESTILNADALYRGHPHFSDNLRRLGAEITEVS